MSAAVLFLIYFEILDSFLSVEYFENVLVFPIGHSRQKKIIEKKKGHKMLKQISDESSDGESDNESEKKKVYICITTWNHYNRTWILKEIHKYGIETASDDITNMHYYRKIAHEKKLPLSKWAILNDYYCVSDTNLPDYLYSFRVFVENYRSLEDNKSNNPIISKVLSYDKTLVFI